MNCRHAALVSLMLFGFASGVHAQQQEPGLYLILDGSGSMWGKLADGQRKISVARDVLDRTLAQGLGGKPVALRAYGHRRKGDCADTELVQPFSGTQRAVQTMRDFVKRVNPRGKTPITRSLRAALKDFGQRQGEIILISDGIETCDADPCALVKEWARTDVAIKVHVVGLGLNAKETQAMQCIASASGTDYVDAQTADALFAGLSKIKEQVAGREFRLTATSQGGIEVPAKGHLLAADGKKIPVASHQRHVIDPGRYELTVGVPTRNGTLYRPISRPVTVKAIGTTRAAIQLPMPPRVSVKYTDNGKARAASGSVHVYQGDKQLFRFRAIDEVFIDEGSYEFRVQPDAFNNLSRTAQFGAADRKVLEFELIRSVRLIVHFLASGSKQRYRGASPRLLQNGAEKFKINGASGGWVLPGQYDVDFSTALTGQLREPITVGDEKEQRIEIMVPSGQITFIYELPDGSRAPDKRLFVSRDDNPTKSHYVSGGRKTDMPVGQYRLTGFNPPDGYVYRPIDFVVTEGADQIVRIRPVAK